MKTKSNERASRRAGASPAAEGVGVLVHTGVLGVPRPWGGDGPQVVAMLVIP